MVRRDDADGPDQGQDGWPANGGSLNMDGAQGAFPPSIALAGPDPYVAWSESTGPAGSA